MEYSSLGTSLAYDPYELRQDGMNDSQTSLRSAKPADFPYEHDQGLRTRNICVAALVVSWVIGIGLVGLAAAILYMVSQHRFDDTYWTMPHMGAQAIPLAINLLLMLLEHSVGYIHTVSLRWSLLRDGRLTFNSNLRLLSSARTSAPNRWYSNIFIIACITMSYASASLLFWHSNRNNSVSDIFRNGHDYVSFGGIPILFLGLGILGMTAISTWALASTNIPSWSSSPLDTALAAKNAGGVYRQRYRSMLAVHDRQQPNRAVYPKRRQRSAWRAHWEVKWVLILLWLLVFICFIWAGVIHKMVKTLRPEWSDFGSWSLLPNNRTYAFTWKPTIGGDTTRSLILILLYATLQGPLTFGLHCAELEMNLSRDESFWRKAASSTGCKLDKYDPIWAAFTSWQSIFLAVCKPVMHWVFGLAVQINNGRVYISAVQTIYLAMLATICASTVTFVSARRPKGPQPAAYGHLQTLVDLVDDWSATIYWGHKADGWPCHAGTAPHELPQVRMDVMYA